MTSLAKEVAGLGQTVLVLQGGGALGAYQVGVYEALDEAGIAPQWVIGTSIGAINAALIAGSKPGERVDKLCEFWSRVQNDHLVPPGLPNWMATAARNFRAITAGVPSFFSPNPMAFLSPHNRLGAEAAGYYSVDPLRQTLEELVDFEQLNTGGTRITVGASSVRTAEMRYFDSRDMPLRLEHVLASGALPPGFPPVRIDGELYWDGGLVSNTPLQWVLDSTPRLDTLAFQVDLWSARGEMPRNLMEAELRQKEIRYSSRTRAATDQFKKAQRLRRAAAKLLTDLPKDLRQTPEAEMLAAAADEKVYNIVHLIYHARRYEGSSKDFEFSRRTMEEHWATGYDDMSRTLAHPEVLQRPQSPDGVFTFDLKMQGRK